MRTIIGIESSCDETSVGIVRGDENLSCVIASSIQEHIKFGGIIPEIASRKHLEVIDIVLRQALDEAKISIEDIDAIGVVNRPGLIGCLSVGSVFAKSLSLMLEKPIIPINHVLAHAFIAFDSFEGKRLPCLALIVSGGHTNLIKINNWIDDIQVLGSTLDDAVGECFDKVGRIANLQYPAGPKIDKIVQDFINSNKDNTNYKFTKPLTDKKFLENHRFDFSFSGLKTAAINKLRDNPNDRDEILYAFEKCSVDVLFDKTMDAANYFNIKNIVIGGGFSANSMLREKFAKFAKIPELKYCTDNGLMVARAANFAFKNNLNFGNLNFEVQSVSDLTKLF